MRGCKAMRLAALASNAVKLLTVIFLATVIAAGACGRANKGGNESASAAGRAGAAAGETYPEPRWPSYFKPPKSADDLMDAAPSSVRIQSGLEGTAMVILPPGYSALVRAANHADPI